MRFSGVSFASLLLLACSSATAFPPTAEAELVGPDPSPTGAPPAGAPPGEGNAFGDLAFEGEYPRAARIRPGGGALLVLERPVSFRDLSPDPDRELVWVARSGAIESRATRTSDGAILDAVVHPSGEVTALRVSDRGFVLERFDVARSSIATFAVEDAETLADPPALRPGESTAPVEEHTHHDVGAIAVDGEDAFLATRTGRHSVVAYRVRWDRGASSFAVRARTLVVPAHSIMPTGLTGGTYDTFGQLAAHYAVRVAVAAGGVGFVGVAHARFDPRPMVRAHEIVFGERLEGDPDALDAYVTRVDVDGARLGTSVVTTEGDEQLYGLRAIGDAAYAVGRTEHWNEQGTGFDAFVARIDRNGEVSLREVAVDRGDIAFDVARASDGSLVLAGASSYWQNPHGASLSEESRAFARRLHDDGSTTAIPIANGPRHNEARFVVPLANGRLWIGGMHDGPGTHSADSDASALRARGFTRSF